VPNIISAYQRTGGFTTEGKKRLSHGDFLLYLTVYFISNSYPFTANKLTLAKSSIAVFTSMNLSIFGEIKGYVSVQIESGII